MNRRPAAARPSDVIGVPAVPPSFATMLGLRLRSAITGLKARTAPPPVAILEATFGLLDHRTMAALCEIGVPEALVEAMAPAELARRTGADADVLERLLRYAAVRRWVRIDRRGRVHPTAVTVFLQRDHPGGWRAWVDFAAGDDITAALARLTARPTDDDPFAVANGAPFFAWMEQHPERWAIFDRAMAAGGRMHALALHKGVAWKEDESICDIGGGTGHLLGTLLDLLPAARGTLVDLGPVVERAVAHERLTTATGDMFEAVPAGGTTYLLVNVLHDWSDEDAGRILSTVARAAGSARVLVVDADLPARPIDRIATGTDVLMAALTGGGRERGPGHIGAIAEEAGLRRVRSTRLASGDWAHELRRRT